MATYDAVYAATAPTPAAASPSALATTISTSASALPASASGYGCRATSYTAALGHILLHYERRWREEAWVVRGGMSLEAARWLEIGEGGLEEYRPGDDGWGHWRHQGRERSGC